jgi:hypothetical protein
MARSPSERDGNDGDDFVHKIVPDPANVPNVMRLVGYPGASSEANHERLYLTPDLSTYIEVPSEDVLHQMRMPADQDPLGAVVLWVKRDASLKYKMTSGAQALANYFAGAIAGAAATGPAMGMQRPAGPTVGPECMPTLVVSVCQPCLTPVCTVVGPACHPLTPACPTQVATVCHPCLTPACPTQMATVCHPCLTPGCTVGQVASVCHPCVTLGCTVVGPACQQLTPACPTHLCSRICTVHAAVCGPTPSGECPITQGFATGCSLNVQCFATPQCGVTRDPAMGGCSAACGVGGNPGGTVYCSSVNCFGVGGYGAV